MPKKRKKSFILLTPGPVNLTSEVRRHLSQPALHHRSLEFERILKSLGKKLQGFFQTSQPVLILNSSGTGAMEAAISNTCSPGDLVLFLSAGKFGERWRDMGLAYGLNVKTLESPWGEAIALKRVQYFLKKHPKTKAVFVQACETSTATNHPVKELAEVLKKYPETLFIVDGITGLGSMDLKMNKWGMDVLIGGSLKAFNCRQDWLLLLFQKKPGRGRLNPNVQNTILICEKRNRHWKKGKPPSVPMSLLFELWRKISFFFQKTAGGIRFLNVRFLPAPLGLSVKR